MLSGKYVPGGGPNDEAGLSRMPIRFESVRTGIWLGEGCIAMADVGAPLRGLRRQCNHQGGAGGVHGHRHPARFMKPFKPEEQDNA